MFGESSPQDQQNVVACQVVDSATGLLPSRRDAVRRVESDGGPLVLCIIPPTSNTLATMPAI